MKGKVTQKNIYEEEEARASLEVEEIKKYETIKSWKDLGNQKENCRRG